MEKQTILVTGATGATGAPTVELLMQKGYPVRAFVHKEDERSTSLKVLGAEIFVGDLHDMEDVRAAWKGIKRGYFCYPLSPNLLDATVMFAQAAKEAGAELIVNLSQKQVASTVKSPATIRHFLSEETFNWSGIPTVHLRATFFSEWFLYVSAAIKAGKLQMAFPERARHAPVAGEDLARTIVAILDEPEQHVGKAYQLFGPEELTYTEIGEIFSRALGKNIVYEQVSIQEMADIIGLGESDHFKNHVAHVISDHLFAGPHMNDRIRTITGKDPMKLAEFIGKNRAAFEA
ncbi:NmrA family NAD(P)-binding protein [Mucilaginibacter sp. 22184]|uniref:NmrA family NAD(P)-binding protein n=1 Tax=Mucilaginibacter sp. 22184 TaxID=3453887 RepID=UPI003F8800A4